MNLTIFFGLLTLNFLNASKENPFQPLSSIAKESILRTCKGKLRLYTQVHPNDSSKAQDLATFIKSKESEMKENEGIRNEIKECLESELQKIFSAKFFLYWRLCENDNKDITDCSLSTESNLFKILLSLAKKKEIQTPRSNGILQKQCQKEVEEYKKIEDSNGSKEDKERESQDVIDLLKIMDERNVRECLKPIAKDEKYSILHEKIKKLLGKDSIAFKVLKELKNPGEKFRQAKSRKQIKKKY